MYKRIGIVIFSLSFLFSIFLVREKNRLENVTKSLEEEIVVLEEKQKKLEQVKKQQEINLLKQKQSDLKIHRDLLMNQSLKLKQDIAIFTKEIETIEG